ncbi:malate synthase [Sporosarcina aquimarina]|uniref:Malate synthase n=1 Tax=Sporosarcina aquimarina TaxID=114975 RepID=A0ABU4G2R9_9BACL|nr:malate synthase [Sporosarcina aquimarina]MDW0111268.1 malate synthase [Sporosarcina aquimarina]
MNLVNEEITHKVFGEGNIVEHEDTIITIEFEKEVKKFVYPDAFKNFITLNDKSAAKDLEEVFLKKDKEEEMMATKLKEEKENYLRDQQLREKMKNFKIHESSQIAFWMDEDEEQTIFEDWNASTGSIQSGKNKGLPNRVARLRPNSSALLTVREVDQPETRRRIRGLYMVNETFTGDVGVDGVVPSHRDFRIQLTDQEAEQMLFWNYYINKSNPHQTSWNSGKFRYFDNLWTAQILKDIIAIKIDENQKNEIQKFLEYFCNLNALDIEMIPEANGELKTH